MKMKAVVMAGGEGSRLRPLTIQRPKPMVPIVNKPVMEHVLDLLKKHGITDIVVTVQYLASVIQKASEGDIKAYVDVASGQSLLDQPPTPGSIVKTTSREAVGVIEWDLSNGARVVLKPTSFKQDEVIFRATSPGGTSLASDKDYVPARTAAQVVGAGGLGKFNLIQLRNILAGKAASVTSYIGDTDEGLAGGASPKDLETLFQLIYLNFTAPRADPVGRQAARWGAAMGVPQSFGARPVSAVAAVRGAPRAPGGQA
jgi:hypothetical protein